MATRRAFSEATGKSEQFLQIADDIDGCNDDWDEARLAEVTEIERYIGFAGYSWNGQELTYTDNVDSDGWAT